MTQTKPIPEGFPVVAPYLCVRGGVQALDFYHVAFLANERFRMTKPDGTIGHAEIEMGGSVIMLADEAEDTELQSPPYLRGTPVALHLYVDDVDVTCLRAASAGAKVLREPTNMFYGDRNALLEDPFGHRWFVSTHIEDVPPQELEKRAAEAFKH